MILKIRFDDALNIIFLGYYSITTKMSQSQPVIPVTMQYGGSDGYGYNQLENEIHRTSDHIKNDIHRSGEHTQADVQRSAYQTQDAIHGSTDQIRGDVQSGTSFIRSDLNADTANVIATLNAQANADQAQTRASQIETRQSVERNADKTSTDANRNADKASLDANRNSDYTNASVAATSTAGLLATQNTSTQGLLATQQSSVATALAVQNTSSDLKTQITDTRRDISGILQSNFAALGVQSEKNAALVSQQVLTQAQAVLLGQKDSEVNASNNRAALALQASENKYNLSLQASDNSKDIQLQAANYKGFLENHITKTAADSILKTSESTSKLMDKIAECCCENRLMGAQTQQLIISTSNANQTSQLQSALASAQQETLLAKFAAIRTTPVV
jgi:hypothetical protein